jgi:hypothetical protein
MARLQTHNVEQGAFAEYGFETGAEEQMLRHFTSESFSIAHMLEMIRKMASLIAPRRKTAN